MICEQSDNDVQIFKLTCMFRLTGVNLGSGLLEEFWAGIDVAISWCFMFFFVFLFSDLSTDESRVRHACIFSLYTLPL